MHRACKLVGIDPKSIFNDVRLSSSDGRLPDREFCLLLYTKRYVHDNYQEQVGQTRKLVVVNIKFSHRPRDQLPMT